MQNHNPAFVQELIQRLQQMYPAAHCELTYQQPHELLIAVILSAQCTDVQVNKVTPALFARYQTVQAFAEADLSELENSLQSIGFFRQKAKFIQETCRLLLTQHQGEIPRTMPELIKLKGVARKTANVVLGELYGLAEGITVDTHVMRLSNRLGLSTGQNATQVEKDLLQIVPAEHRIMWSHWLIFHGRRVCNARSPRCSACQLNDICPSKR